MRRERSESEDWSISRRRAPAGSDAIDAEPQDVFPEADSFIARRAQGLRLERRSAKATRADGDEALEPRGLCRRGADAARSSHRPARARLRRSGAPADRPASHRHDRRGRLSAAAICDASPSCSARRSSWSRRRLRVMQGFEPCGVFARDLRECLTLQLKEQDRCDPAMAALDRESAICSPPTTSSR